MVNDNTVYTPAPASQALRRSVSPRGYAASPRGQSHPVHSQDIRAAMGATEQNSPYWLDAVPTATVSDAAKSISVHAAAHRVTTAVQTLLETLVTPAF